MHPVEHLLYFSPFVLWWIVPVHPIVIIVTGLYQALNPAVSHSGFEYLRLGDKLKVSAGDWYHQLHHRYFNLNYGNKFLPIDKLTDSTPGTTVATVHCKRKSNGGARASDRLGY